MDVLNSFCIVHGTEYKTDLFLYLIHEILPVSYQYEYLDCEVDEANVSENVNLLYPVAWINCGVMIPIAWVRF